MFKKSFVKNRFGLRPSTKLTYVCADHIGERISKSYADPYDAFSNQNSHQYADRNNLCLVKNKKVVEILNKMIAIKWSVACSEHVLFIYELAFPKDKKPRKALEAASLYIKIPSEYNASVVFSYGNILEESARLSRINSRTIAAAYTIDSICQTIRNINWWHTHGYSCPYTAVQMASTAFATYVDGKRFFDNVLDMDRDLEYQWQHQKLKDIIGNTIFKLLASSQYNSLKTHKKFSRKPINIINPNELGNLPPDLIRNIGSYIRDY